MIGIGIIILASVCAIGAQWIAPYDPVVQNTATANADPFFAGSKYVNPDHILGSDELGRDILSRLIWSARVSMIVGLVPTLIVFTVGVTLGLVAGYFGGWIDNLLMRFTDVIYAFPDLLFVIIIMATLRNTWLGEIAGGLV